MADKVLNSRENSLEDDSIEMRGKCWETILHRFLSFSHILQVEGLTPFVLNCHRKDICIAKIADRDSISLWNKGQFSLLPVIKDLESLNSVLLCCLAVHLVYSCHLVLFALPYEH